MAEDFKSRIDRVFGSLLQSAPSSSPSPSSPSPWSLSDDALERREWNRDESGVERDETPSSSSFDGLFPGDKKLGKKKKSKSFRDELEKEQEDSDDDDGGNDDNEELVGDDGLKSSYQDEDEQMRSAVGLDSTLDREDEEDEYDKVAVGRENAGDRIYMKDVNDYGPNLNYHNVLPDSLGEGNLEKDPRANHFAARARLEEDDQDASQNVNSHHTRDTLALKQANGQEQLKPILKKRDRVSDTRPSKRVRFDPQYISEKVDMETCQPPINIHANKTQTGEQEVPVGTSSVPDYIRNPSKYTCYSLDWSAENDTADNLRAFHDFNEMILKAKGLQEGSQAMAELPKSLTFIPRKKNAESMECSKTGSNEDAAGPQATRLIGIAANEDKEGDGELCAMEEDELESPSTGKKDISGKAVRQYRAIDSFDESKS